MVKVYSISNCPWCDKVKKYLKSRHVDFAEFNIELDKAAYEECHALTNDDVVPVTTENGKDFVLGFDKAKIDVMLGLT